MLSLCLKIIGYMKARTITLIFVFLLSLAFSETIASTPMPNNVNIKHEQHQHHRRHYSNNSGQNRRHPHRSDMRIDRYGHRNHGFQNSSKRNIVILYLLAKSSKFDNKPQNFSHPCYSFYKYERRMKHPKSPRTKILSGK